MKFSRSLIAGLGFSLLVGVGVGRVSFAEELDTGSGLVDQVLAAHCEYAEEVLGEPCISNTYNNDHRELKKLSQNEAGPFHNLYLFTYQNVVEAPKDAALEQLAKVEQNYSRAELEQLIFNDDLRVITAEEKLSEEEVATALEELEALEADLEAEAESMADESGGISEEFLAYIAQANYINAERRRLENNDSMGTQMHLLREYSSIMESYQRELQFQTENRKLAYQAYANEIFFDNDLNNSANIDILHDLDLINYLIFGEFIVYPDRSADSEEAELSSEETVLPLVNFEEESEVELSAEEESEELNPYVCLEDESLREALDAFESYVATAPDPEETDIVDDEPDTDPENPEEIKESDTAVKREEFTAFVESLTVNEGSWERTLPCNEIFCITVNLVKGSWGTTSGSNSDTYEETDNCIACHLDFIAAATDETLSGGVQPNKVSQNWFEEGSCKDVSDGLNLDFNVYAIPVPIALDPSDDSDDRANDSFEDTYTSLLEWSYLNNPNALGRSGAKFDQETYLNSLNVAGSNATIEETLAALAEIEETKTQELVEILTASDIEVKVKSSHDLAQQMQNEFNSMLLYFMNYSDWLKATYMEENAPLNEILKKPYCP